MNACIETARLAGSVSNHMRLQHAAKDITSRKASWLQDTYFLPEQTDRADRICATLCCTHEEQRNTPVRLGYTTRTWCRLLARARACRWQGWSNIRLQIGRIGRGPCGRQQGRSAPPAKQVWCSVGVHQMSMVCMCECVCTGVRECA